MVAKNFGNMLNMKGAARHIGIGRQSLSKFMKGKMPSKPPTHYRVGGKILFKPEDLDLWMESMKSN